ncbi:hypothetical protein [Isoptericola sp. NPDC057391]|uniref:hypothetical protein n=1 Tax=Isoptericola sp. NPDC057391 TaxID=3346117 RepID=UPI0036322D08
MLVLKEITDAAASHSTLGVGEVSLRPALQGSVDLPKITTAMPGDAELDDEEWADAAVDAIHDVADQIRSTGRDVESAWTEALGAVEGGDLQKLLGHTALLQAQVERLRAGYDEWYGLLGGLSNVAPHRLSGVARAEVLDFLAWLNA